MTLNHSRVLSCVSADEEEGPMQAQSEMQSQLVAIVPNNTPAAADEPESRQV